jgi:hypothetical protein
VLAGLVWGWSGTADAYTQIEGPFTWHGSSYPNDLQLAYAESYYCWLTGFSVGYSGKDASADQVYVYIANNGFWYLGGSTATQAVAPSSSSWGQAMCIAYFNAVAPFQPWAGIVTGGSCPSTTNVHSGGACWGWEDQYPSPGTQQVYSEASANLWTPADQSGSINTAWSNAFCAMSGISYSGNTAIINTLQPFIQIATSYTDEPLKAWVQGNEQSNIQIAVGVLWPFNNSNWFWSGGAGQTMAGYAANGGSAVLGPTSQLCALQDLNIAAHSGAATVYISASGGSWVLTASKGVDAGALCLPIPYATN